MAPTYFDDQWLGMKAYKEWLLCGDDRTSAKCKVCPILQNKIELFDVDGRQTNLAEGVVGATPPPQYFRSIR